VTVWVVVCLAVIIGIVALGMDGGRMMEERRHDQTAADAAALAAASDLYFNWWQNHGTDPDASARAAALASAAANGYANDGTTSDVTVNIPPTSGAFAGKAEYIEVIVQSRLQASFSAIFTRDALPVRGRAVARGRPSNVGLLLLQGSGSNSLTATGNAQVTVTSASIVVDSADTQPYAVSGNASVAAASHDVAGSHAPGGKVVGPVNTAVPPTPDPLASLSAPNPADYPLQSTEALSLSGNSTATLQPGVYRGGIRLSGNAAVTLAPGVYILEGGGLQLSGNGSLSGNGVLIYNTGCCHGSISLSGNGNVSLSAPSGGPYQGITIFQDRSATAPVQLSGNGSIQLAGALYAPGATVQMSGNGSASGTAVGAFIVNSVQLSGNAGVTVNQGGNRMRIPQVGLVE
jgi:hypothetical protein